MNTIEGQEAARERLLDVALEQVLAEGAGSTGRQRARRRHWFAAATIVLGAGVVTAFAALVREDDARRATGRQDPVEQRRPLPEPTVLTDEAELADLPATTEHLVVQIGDLSLLQHLRRLPGLRALVMLEAGGGQRQPRPLCDDPAALEPLAGLEQLERLQLPSNLQLQPRHIESLRGLPNLSRVQLSWRRVDEGTRAALSQLPGLRELNLQLVPFDADWPRHFVDRQLVALRLLSCPGIDDAAWAGLGRMASLRSLAVTGQDSIALTEIDGERFAFADLGEAAFRSFEALPQLVELDLDETSFPDAFMARLPVHLRRLNLGDHLMNAGTIEDLRRLADLRDLSFHHNVLGDAAAGLLATLALERVDLRGWSDQRVIDAIGRHPTLREVTLRWGGGVDLRPLTRAPRLRRLHLPGGPDNRLDDDDPVLRALVERGVSVDHEQPHW